MEPLKRKEGIYSILTVSHFIPSEYGVKAAILVSCELSLANGTEGFNWRRILEED